MNIAVPNINIVAELEGAVALLVNYQTQIKKFDDDIQSCIIDATQLKVDMEEIDQYVLALNYTLSLLKDRIKNLKDGDVLNIGQNGLTSGTRLNRFMTDVNIQE